MVAKLVNIDEVVAPSVQVGEPEILVNETVIPFNVFPFSVPPKVTLCKYVRDPPPLWALNVCTPETTVVGVEAV